MAEKHKPLVIALKWKPTHRHVKSGEACQFLGEVMDATEDFTAHRRLKLGKEYHDAALLAHKVLYRDGDGHLFVRELDEFHGRFKPIPDA